MISWSKTSSLIEWYVFQKDISLGHAVLFISYLSTLLFYASNYIIDSLLPLVTNKISYLVIFTYTIRSSISLEDVLECSAQIIGCVSVTKKELEEPEEDKHLVDLALSDPATLRIKARRVSIMFQYFS